MKRGRAATVLLLGLLACVPSGLAGEMSSAYFATSTRCAGCDYIRQHAVGAHTVGVGFVDCPTEPWTVSATGPGDDFRASFHLLEDADCSGELSFGAEEEGLVRLTVTSTELGVTLDAITLRVVTPDVLTIALRDAPRAPVDPARVVVPEGAFVSLAPYAAHDAKPVILDESRVRWSFEGDAIAPAPALFGPEPDPSLFHAAALGTGSVHATLGALETSVEIEVRPIEEISADDPICLASFESCDGVDNDCDGEIDGSFAQHHCWITAPPGALTQCVAGACVRTGCVNGRGDCDGDGESCETPLDTITDCGACGNACPEGEVCLLGGCVPTIAP